MRGSAGRDCGGILHGNVGSRDPIEATEPHNCRTDETGAGDRDLVAAVGCILAGGETYIVDCGSAGCVSKGRSRGSDPINILHRHIGATDRVSRGAAQTAYTTINLG